MELSKKLQASGWYLTEEGMTTLTSGLNGAPDPSKIIDEALNHDLRDIGGGALSTKREEGCGTLSGRIVLQVQKIRNIAAPKSNEESKVAPRMLLLDLSDGQTILQALEVEPVLTLNLNIAPGTKIYIKAEKLELIQDFLMLRPNDIQILGGRVDALYEKWEFTRTMLKYARSGRPPSGVDVPPPWVAFGKSIDDNADRNFKSLAPSSDKDKASKENDEFKTMRNEAIAVASKAAVKKVFGGGGQYIVDHNIKKILDKGYNKDEAKAALQASRNNLERALFNLKRNKDAAAGGYSDPPVRGGRGERPGRDGKRGANLKDEAEAGKPATNATLFDFLTTKLRTTDAPVAGESIKRTPTADKPISKPHENDSKPSSENKMQSFGERTRFENNVSSSFAANRGGHSGRPPRVGGRNRPNREDRPLRGGGNVFNEREATAAGGNIRRPDNHLRPTDQSTHGKIAIRNGHDNTGVHKSTTDEKQELGHSVAKDQGSNRRNNERNNNRNGNIRPDNGNVNNNHNNRRRQQGNGLTVASAPAAKTTNSFNIHNDDFNTRLNKVVEETTTLKVSISKREPRRGGRQSGGQSNRQVEPQATTLMPISKSVEKAIPGQRQHQVQSENARPQSNSNYSQLPNGYTYDPSKIMGFQTKETNEFAMSLLKSQGLTVVPNNQAPAQSLYKNKPTNSNSSLTSAPQKRATIHVVSNPQPTVTSSPPENFGVTSGDGWEWKTNDLCMAKYWDDGRYYEAEITAVSENTCVVFFLGYGNHEEVLKSDILPITDSQNRPLTNMSQQQQPSRYRDRQTQQQKVYVPPHKRDY